MDTERREFTRYVMKEDEIQVFSLDPKISGRLNDISSGGLSFQYTPIKEKKLETNSINILTKVHIFEKLNLLGIACQIIYDIASLEEGGSFTGAERRQCGIKFLGLEENQLDQLEEILKKFYRPNI